MADFICKADIEAECGGAAQLIEWLDKDGDGIADSALVAKAISAGVSDLSPYIEVTWDLSSIQPPYPQALILNCAKAAAYHAARIGSDGQTVPPTLVDARAEALAWAKDVATKRATLGRRNDAPSLSPVPQLVDPDPLSTQMSIAGLRKGFR